MPSGCPTTGELEALLKGELAAADSARLEKHLLECAACRQKLDSLAGGDESWLKARYADQTDPVTSHPLREAMHRLKNVGETPVAHGIRLRYLGDYEILEEIGRGGMGVVYRARQLSLQREVAVKVILAGQLASDADVRRFHVEAEAAAKLDHPNIVPIFEIGEDEGHRFFSMKLVEGGSLAQVISKQTVKTEASSRRSEPEVGCYEAKDATKLVATIARAVHYAHQRGVLHRDLKPGNILLDREGQPHVTDFGLAKLIEHDSSLTHSAAVMGSPSYMAPEQAAGHARDATTAADVYSVGAILYAMLTGRPPFEAESTAKTIRLVLEVEPISPRAHNPSVPEDLATICLKCLEKEPGRRYGTAEALAEDLGRFLRNEPVAARPVGRMQQVWRWCRRKPALAGSLASLIVVFAFGLTGILSQWYRAEKHADGETRERHRAETALQKMQLQRAEDFFNFGKASLGLSSLARMLRENPSNRVAAERLLSALSHRNFALPSAPPLQLAGAVSFAKFSPDGLRVMTGSQSGEVCLWNSRSGALLVGPMRHEAGIVHAQFSPNGERIASASLDRTARVWDAQTGAQIGESLQHSSRVCFVQFSPDGKRVATASEDETARVWDAQTGAPVTPPLKHRTAVLSIRFSPDGQRVVTAAQGKARLWNASTGEQLGAPLEDPNDDTSGYGWVPVRDSAQFSPDGTRVAAAVSGTLVRICDAKTGVLLVPPLRHKAFVLALAFSPDGTRLATVGWDRTARLWDCRTGQQIGEPLQHADIVVACQFSADGRRLLTLGLQGLLHIWDPLDTTEPKLTLGRLSQVHDAYCADFDPSGSSLITAFGKGAAQIWDIREGSILGLVVHDSSGGAIRTPHFSPDGKRILAVSGFDARIWSTETGQPLTQPLRHQNRRVSVDGGRFSSDGQAIVTWGMETNIYLWHGHTGQPLFPPVDVGETVKDAEFSSDGRRVVVVPLIGRLRLCDTRSGEVTKLSGTGGRDLYQGFAHFNSVGDQLITPSSSNEVAIWSIAQNGFLTVRFHHGGKITSARFSPDGKQLVTTSVDNTACIWNVLNGTLVCPPLLHRAGVTDASFSADGTKVLTTCDDFSAQVWNAWSGQRLTEPLQHSLVIWSASFDRSGTRVVTVSDDGTTRIWNAQTGEPIAEALGKPFRGVGAEFSSDGRFLIGAYVRDGVRVWELPEAPLAVPGWMLELAGAVADLGGGTGPTASIAATNLLRLKEQILNNPEENSYTRWARWFFADRETRTVSPSRHMTVPEYVQRRIKENTQSTLREATLLSPTNVFAFARLAELFARNSQSAADADWFSRYATNLAATDPEVLRTRESVVKKLRAAAEARQTAAAP